MRINSISCNQPSFKSKVLIDSKEGNRNVKFEFDPKKDKLSVTSDTTVTDIELNDKFYYCTKKVSLADIAQAIYIANQHPDNEVSICRI